MLPTRRAAPQHTSRRRTHYRQWCSLSVLLLLLAFSVAMPFVFWQYHTLKQAASPGTTTTPLQRLQQQKAGLGQLQGQSDLEDTRPAQGQQHSLIDDGGQQPVTAEQIAAAQAYLSDTVLHPKRRPTVPASHYVMSPEPYDMRQQHTKVKAYLASAEFAARQAARQAKGERGIIINAGGPHLVSSAMVTLKVLRDVLNCTLPVELVWHTADEMDAQTLAALQARWGPIRGVDLSTLPWPSHHRRLPVAAAAEPAAAGQGAAQPAGAAAASSTGQAAGGVEQGSQPHTPPAAPGQHVARHNAGAGSGSGKGTGAAAAEGDAEEGLPAERAAAKQRGFLYKVLSLSATSFASALLLDADNLPLTNPEGLWEDVSFKLYGNLFWPDFWPPGSNADAEDVVYDMVGLEAKEAAVLIAAGKGRGGMAWRGTESGQVLFDLVQHGDVAEWAVWINSFGDTVYRALWGDKDTYALAFAVAGKAHVFNQLQVPPAGAFSWRPSSVLIKAANTRVDGWQLAGMVQYDAWGQAAFLHRTMNKFSWGGEAWHIGLLTAPLTRRWIQYYLSLDSLGPTVGVPVTYAAPASAFTTVSLDNFDTGPAPDTNSSSSSSNTGNSDKSGKADTDCPAAVFESYWSMRQHAVPIGRAASGYLEPTACRTALAALVAAPLAAQYKAAQLELHPELLALAAAALDGAGLPLDQHQHHQNQHNNLADSAARRHDDLADVPNATPVVAWVLPKQHLNAATSAVTTTTQQVVQASYEAFDWLRTHAVEFPLLAKTGSNVAGNSSSGSSGSGHEMPD